MCEFYGTWFPCGCATWKGSEYKYCRDRGKGCQAKEFRQFEWQTFCPQSRMAMKGKSRYDDSIVLPKCCSHLEKEKLEALCLKCNSLKENTELLHCYCPEHMVCVSSSSSPTSSSHTKGDVENEFEKVVQLWPSNLKTRYYRRKQDKTARDCGWSL